MVEIVEISDFVFPIRSLRLTRRSQARPYLSTSLGFYEHSVWTDWADEHLLKSLKVLEVVKRADYSFWVKYFSS
jgi:hypothetical protein